MANWRSMKDPKNPVPLGLPIYSRTGFMVYVTQRNWGSPVTEGWYDCDAHGNIYEFEHGPSDAPECWIPLSELPFLNDKGENTDMTLSNDEQKAIKLATDMVAAVRDRNRLKTADAACELLTYGITLMQRIAFALEMQHERLSNIQGDIERIAHALDNKPLRDGEEEEIDMQSGAEAKLTEFKIGE